MSSQDASRLDLVPSPTPAQRRSLDLAADVAKEDAAGRGELAFLARLLATTISCSWSGAVAGVAGQAEVGARIASRSVVWWRSCRAERPPGILDGGWLVLSQEFYEEILAHPVPLDRRVLRALTSSFALDLYAWATYRVSRLQRRVQIPWPELARQFGSQERVLRDFRVETRRALERIRVFYRELRFEVRREGLWLWPGRSHVQRQAVPKRAARGPEEPDERVARISGR